MDEKRKAKEMGKEAEKRNEHIQKEEHLENKDLKKEAKKHAEHMKKAS